MVESCWFVRKHGLIHELYFTLVNEAAWITTIETQLGSVLHGEVLKDKWYTTLNDPKDSALFMNAFFSIRDMWKKKSFRCVLHTAIDSRHVLWKCTSSACETLTVSVFFQIIFPEHCLRAWSYDYLTTNQSIMVNELECLN